MRGEKRGSLPHPWPLQPPIGRFSEHHERSGWFFFPFMQVKAFNETVTWMIWSLLNNLSCLLNIPYWVHHTTAKHFAVLQTLDKPCFVYSKVRVNYPAETEGDRGRRARRKQKEAASYVNQFPALNTSLEVKQIFCIKIHCFSVCISARGCKNGYTWSLNYIFSIGKSKQQKKYVQSPSIPTPLCCTQHLLTAAAISAPVTANIVL